MSGYAAEDGQKDPSTVDNSLEIDQKRIERRGLELWRMDTSRRSSFDSDEPTIREGMVEYSEQDLIG